jgi:glycosyltransferase involved in cell wall biosynthesis
MSARERRLKILALTSTFPRWQGDTCPMFVADLCRGLAREMDVTVLAPGSHGARSSEQRDGYTVRRFRYAWPSRLQRLADGAILPNIKRNPLLLAQAPPFVLAQFFAAYRLMRRERFDAIHAHWAVPQGVIASILKRRFGVPVVTTTHGGDIYALNGGPARRAKTWALRSSDHVTAVSSALKAEVVALGIDERQVDVLPMGVDTTRFTPQAFSPALRARLNPLGPVLLFVGRLVEKKGARYAIEGMPKIVAAHPDARLIIVGDGPLRSELEALARHLDVAGSVTFAGAVANGDLPAYYASADVFIGPSIVEASGDTESFGVVFAEAMASGCPVIATDVGGIADVTGNGAHARLVPQRNADAIAAAACELLGDRALHASLRDRGIEEMRRSFDHRPIHESYARLIERAAA